MIVDQESIILYTVVMIVAGIAAVIIMDKYDK
jgi:hypothetical protein